MRDVVGAEEVPPDEAGGVAALSGSWSFCPTYTAEPCVSTLRSSAAADSSPLAGAFESAVAEQALHLFTLLGQAGVGKSRLVREFADGVESVATVLQGRCLPYGETITYWALSEALRDAGLPEPELGDEPVSSVRVIFERPAHERPLVVLLDDVHWAEAAVPRPRGPRRVLARLTDPARVRRAPDLSTAAGLGRRPAERQLGSARAVERDRVRASHGQPARESDLDESIRDYVVSTAEGNPLFVEELLATLVDRDVLRREAGRWTTTEVAAIPLPPTIKALIAARIDRLPDGERTVLEPRSGRRPADIPPRRRAELAPDELRADVDAHLLACSAQGARTAATRPGAWFLVSPPADPRRRLRVAADAGTSGAARAPRRAGGRRVRYHRDQVQRTGPLVDDLVRYHRDPRAALSWSALGSAGSNVKPV